MAQNIEPINIYKFYLTNFLIWWVVGTKPCIRCPLEVRGKVIREVGGVADKHVAYFSLL
jgi:hypothetical protein